MSKREDVLATCLYKRAQLADRNGDLQLVLLLARAAAQFDPSRYEVQLLAASAARRLFKISEAEELYLTILATQPRNAQALLSLGFIYRDTGRIGRALPCFEALVEHHPTIMHGRLELGRAYLAAGWLDRAARTLMPLATTRSGFWLSVVQEARRAHESARQRVKERLSNRAALTGSDLVVLALDLLRLGKTRLAARLCASGEKTVSLLELEYEFRRRTISLKDAVAMLSAANVEEDSLRLLLAEGQLGLGDSQAALSTVDGIASDKTRKFALMCRIACLQAMPSGLSEEIRREITAAAFPTGRCQHFLSTLVCSSALALHRPVSRTEITAPESDDIPYKLFQYWDSPGIPEDVDACMRTWSQISRIQTVLFDGNRSREFIAANYSVEHLEAFEACHHPAMRADFIRLAYLFRNGGIYIDADEMCIAPLWSFYQEWKHSMIVLVLSATMPNYILNQFIAAKPGCSVLGRALGEAVSTILENRKSGRKLNIWDTTGPGLLTRNFSRALLQQGSECSSVTVLAFEEYGAMCKEQSNLNYKSKPEGNWRLK